jgi:vacuolar-type H+-ATPase subunit H
VPLMRDFLSRFRPAGAPGAGRAAVPADRRRQLESELGPVLMLLDGPSAECSGVVAAAQRDAEQIVHLARTEADRIRSAAQQRASASVAELVQRAVATARAEATAIATGGAAEAAAITERAGQRLPLLTDRAVALVRSLGEQGGSS